MYSEAPANSELPISSSKMARTKPKFTRRKPSRPDSSLDVDCQAVRSNTAFELPEFVVYDCCGKSDVGFRPMTLGDVWRRKREFERNKKRPFIPLIGPAVLPSGAPECDLDVQEAEEGSPKEKEQSSPYAAETIFAYAAPQPPAVTCQLSVSTCDHHLLSAASPSPSSQADSGWTSPDACTASGSEDHDEPAVGPKPISGKRKSVTFVIGEIGGDKTDPLSESSSDDGGRIRRVRRYPRSIRNATTKTTKWRSQADIQGESGYQSESRGSPLTDDAEAVIVEPIPRAESKRRNYQQRAHSTSTFDDAAGQPVVQPILFDRRNHGSDPSLRRYASGLGSSRDLDENERISYSMPPAHQHPPPRVLRTLSQSYQQNNYQRPRRPSNLQNFNSPSQPFTGQRRYDNRTNSFDRNNVENIAIAVTVPTNGSGPKSAPPITAKNPRASVGSASQAPPNAFPQRAYQFTSARDHVQSAGQIMGMPQHVEVSQMDVLSERIFHFHHTVEQPQQLLNRKLQLRDMIYYTISPIFPMCGLYIVGSSLNGFGNAKSDMDLCLMITNKDLDQRTDAVVVLSSIMRALQDVKFITSMQMILAKVPILRMKFASPFDDIVVDLNANNSVAIRNTHLLCYYSSFDWRVRPLVSVVKEWAKRRGINDANRSSFTSYSLVLLVIHYLQCGASPPVLPSLQQLYQKRFSAKADVRNLNVSIPLDPPPQQHWEYRNKQSLGELLINFLEYYAKRFNFDNDAISVRMGKKTGRAFVAKNASPYNHLSQWRCICIEEPFTLTNTAHSVYDERVFQAIKQSFVEGYKVLEETRDLDAFLSAASSATAIPNIGSGHHYQQQPVNDGRPQ